MDDIDKKIEKITKDYQPSKSKRFYVILLSSMSALALLMAIAIIVLLTFK